MTLLRTLGLLFALSTAAYAQSPYTVTGTVQDNTGHPAASGYVQFSISPASQSILYHVTGTTVIAPQNTKCGINSVGLIKDFVNLSNPCLVWGNDLISPGNTTYTVSFAPKNVVTQVVHQLQINTVCTNLNTPCFVPQVQIVPQYQTITTSPIAVNLIPVSPHVFNVGQAALPYAAGYFDNLFSTDFATLHNVTITGSCTGCLSGGGVSLLTATLPIVATPSSIVNIGTFSCPTCRVSGTPITSADLNITPTTCTNQFLTVLGATGLGICTPDILASAQHANQGTTATVLHGNAAGNPAFGAVSLTVDVSGTLPVANGGTGQTSGTVTFTIATGTATLGTSLIASGACATVVTVAGTGVATTDNIMADFNADPTSTTGYSASANGMLTIIKYPTSGNVNFKVCNNTSAGVTPGAATLNWRVVR